MPKRKTTYTDAMILAMCDSRTYWAAELRAAAKQRGIAVTGVTQVNAIVRALREAIACDQRQADLARAGDHARRGEHDAARALFAMYGIDYHQEGSSK